MGAMLRRILIKAWNKYWPKYGMRWLLGMSLVLIASLQVWGVFNIELITRMDSFFYGLRMRAIPPVLDKRIVIVDIDEKSLTEIGRFPWSRDKMADLVNNLSKIYQVRAIGFDISFSEPDTSSGYETLAALGEKEFKEVPAFQEKLQALKPALDYDARLAQALKNSPSVLGYVFSEKQRKGVLPPPAFTLDSLNGRNFAADGHAGYEANIPILQKAATHGGYFSLSPDPDGVVRSVPWLQKADGAVYPSLALATAYVYLNATSIFPALYGTADTWSKNDLNHGGYEIIRLYYPPGKHINIRAGDKSVTLVQFRGTGGPAGGAFRYFSAADIIKGRIAPAELNGTIVLIGTTAPGLNDIRATPVSAGYPGVEVHANIIKSILDEHFTYRPDYSAGFEFIQILVFGLILGLLLPTRTPVYSVLSTLVVVAVAAALNYWVYYRDGIVLNLAMLFLLILFLFIVNAVWGFLFEFRNRQAIVGLFGEYVAPELVAEMADNPANYNMEGESRELTVLFVDVRGFTTISEGLSPKALREFINIYLTAMSEDIRGNRGTLDKYIGDAVMAFWGAPVELPDHASRAVGSALKMLETAHRLNDEFVARGWPQLKIGIGLNTGQMHVGDMGSRIRRAYTVMGDAVNLGSRLEGITKVYGVGLVVGESTKLAAPEYFYRELDCVRVKGKHEPIPIFEPVAESSKVDSRVRAATERWHQAYALVRQQKWDHAQEILDELIKLYPNEVLYKLYSTRIEYYRQHPPGANWDGVTTFETK